MSGPSATMYNEGWDVTLRDRIDEANKQNVSDMNSISGNLNNTIAQGLGFYNDPSHQQQFNDAYSKANELMNSSQMTPGSVDMSNYQPYMDLGKSAATQAGILSGAYTTPSRDGMQAGYDANGKLVLAPGGVDVRPVSSNDIYNMYLNNPATQAQMDQGNRQITSNYAAQGLLGSGSLLKALQSYGQGIASQNLGQAQQNLYNLAQLGSNSANQYATGLLNKYQTDQQSALGAMQNKTNIYGQQVNALNSQNNALNTQTNFLSSLAGTNAQLQAQAANQRQSSLANSATKYTETDQMGWGGARGSMNTKYAGA